MMGSLLKRVWQPVIRGMKSHRHRKLGRKSAHRMAMLLATLAFMPPVYARVTDVLGLPPQVSIGIQPPLTIAIALGYEWTALGRLTKESAAMLAFSISVVLLMVAGLLVWFT